MFNYVPSGRKPEVKDDICYILLQNGNVAICDAENYSIIKDSTWRLNNFGYVMRKKGKTSELLHRLLHPEWSMIDHISGNRLDNRGCNLRECTPNQNGYNRKKHKIGLSQFKGVTWDKHNKRWNARIKFNNKLIFIGSYHSEIEAAKAYDAMASCYYREFACLNFPN